MSRGVHREHIQNTRATVSTMATYTVPANIICEPGRDPCLPLLSRYTTIQEQANNNTTTTHEHSNNSDHVAYARSHALCLRVWEAGHHHHRRGMYVGRFGSRWGDGGGGIAARLARVYRADNKQRTIEHSHTTEGDAIVVWITHVRCLVQ